MESSKSDILFEGTPKIKVAVLTGAHPFDVPHFHDLFRSFTDIVCYPQHIEQFTADWGTCRTQYDVVVFFNWNLDTPGETTSWWDRTLPRYEQLFGDRRAVLQELGSRTQGIVVLHHALGAFPHWRFWSELMGVRHEGRAFDVDAVMADPQKYLAFNEGVHFEVAGPRHAITQGLTNWDMVSETWSNIDLVPVGDTRVLLTTDHPKMKAKAMAWIHQYKLARVFCLQPGHDNENWANDNFRTMLLRGILWVAGRL